MPSSSTTQLRRADFLLTAAVLAAAAALLACFAAELAMRRLAGVVDEELAEAWADADTQRQRADAALDWATARKEAS